MGKFAAAVRAWSFAEASAEIYRQHFASVGHFDEDGKPRPGLDRWDRAEATAKNLRRRLALDPAELATLVTKLAAVEPAGGRATAELEALRAEIAEVDNEIAQVEQQRERDSGD